MGKNSRGGDHKVLTLFTQVICAYCVTRHETRETAIALVPLSL